jgi:hypothetical protein
MLFEGKQSKTRIRQIFHSHLSIHGRRVVVVKATFLNNFVFSFTIKVTSRSQWFLELLLYTTIYELSKRRLSLHCELENLLRN